MISYQLNDAVLCMLCSCVVRKKDSVGLAASEVGASKGEALAGIDTGAAAAAAGVTAELAED